MQRFRRSVRGTLYTAVLWAGTACCGYALTSNQDPARDCLAGTPALEDYPQPAALPVPDALRTRAGYEREISRIESESGAFAYHLVPELIGMGMVQREAGESTDAAKTLLRAFYIVRMHQGLYSPGQIPLLDMLIESHGSMGHWKIVADAYDHLYWLYRRNYGEHDPRLLPVLKRLRQWHIDAYYKDTGRTLGQHFRAARELYLKAVAILMACGKDEKLALCFWNQDCCSTSGLQQGSCPADNS